MLFWEGNHREEVLEGCSTDPMGMQVSPNSASALARCVNNETDLKTGLMRPRHILNADALKLA